MPFTVEHVRVPDEGSFDFNWSGDSAYLALHDMVLSDGGMVGDDIGPITLLDMRRRLTFLPLGVRVEGWSQTTRRSNSFTALYFDQNWLLDELEIAPQRRSLQPMVYFQNATLMHTLARLAELACDAAPAPAILADSLAIMAGAELMRSIANEAVDGGLTPAQVAAVRDFVQAHLFEDVSVGEMAAIAGLSVFHFTRQFKKSVGVTPYRFVLEARTETAKHLLQDGTLPLSVVAEMAGFSSPSHFSRTFSEIVGMTPREFRNARA